MVYGCTPSTTQMKFLAAVAALFLTSVFAPAAILIFDGPAPMKTFGTDYSTAKNRAMLVYDTTSGQIGIINYHGRRGRGQQHPIAPLAVNGGTISLKRGSMTVLTGVEQFAAAGDFDTRFVNFRGRNDLLNRSANLTGPRVLSGTARVTTRYGGDFTHTEQSFSLAYQTKLSNASNAANDTFENALNRITIVLQNRGFATLPR